MSKVIAIMSMSLDGYVADRNDGVDEVFDWYFTSGDVEISSGGSNPIAPGLALIDTSSFSRLPAWAAVSDHGRNRNDVPSGPQESWMSEILVAA